jgi:hypothetical protein
MDEQHNRCRFQKPHQHICWVLEEKIIAKNVADWHNKPTNQPHQTQLLLTKKINNNMKKILTIALSLFTIISHAQKADTTTLAVLNTGRNFIVTEADFGVAPTEDPRCCTYFQAKVGS